MSDEPICTVCGQPTATHRRFDEPCLAPSAVSADPAGARRDAAEFDALRERIIEALQECNDESLDYEQAADRIVAALPVAAPRVVTHPDGTVPTNERGEPYAVAAPAEDARRERVMEEAANEIEDMARCTAETTKHLALISLAAELRGFVRVTPAEKGMAAK